MGGDARRATALYIVRDSRQFAEPRRKLGSSSGFGSADRSEPRCSGTTRDGLVWLGAGDGQGHLPSPRR